MRAAYDLHIHSCLSPCGADDMTPANLVAMAALAGYDIIALSDHNSTRNCRAAAAAAAANGLAFVPAMELTTSEEAHILCLLPSLDAADAFGEYVYSRLPEIPNKPEFFGNQLVMDENDMCAGIEPRLLISATSIGAYETAELVRSFGGAALPAHIDRSSFSVISNLGFYDERMGYTAVEITRAADIRALAELNSQLRGVGYIVDSDAHSLEAMPDPAYRMELASLDAAGVIEAVLRGALSGRIDLA